ncbi:MAG: hypothetical protein AB2535_19890 [Candidatus Thiodiazotropha endolucinida]
MNHNLGLSEPALGSDSLEEKYLLEEYKALRAEVLNRENIDDAVQRYALLAMAAFYAYILKDSTQSDVGHTLFLVPTAISLYTLIRIFTAKMWFCKLGEYLKTVEAYAYRSSGLGWERFLEGDADITRVRLRHTIAARSFWGALLLLNLYVVVFHP